MKKLSVKQKLSRSILIIIILLLPLVFCAWLAMGDNALLKEIEHITAVFILPSAFFLACARLLYRTWK